MKIQVMAYVIFIHPEFTLYQMPPNQNILLPSLLNKHLRELNKISAPLHSEHKRLARLINDRHMSDNQLAKKPHYSYEELRKGATCLKCQSWHVKVIERSTHCLSCSFRERNGEVILRKLGEYQVLFPDKELKTDRIYEWCGKNYSKESVRRVLSQNFEEKGTGKGRYYV
ncbi:hypothetical protein GCM10008932_22950 [Alkalibacterium iburiense]|uniref:NERD domain-containing protein n=1 Tax=Alkalibacterium iburiense TaxID=290589 RepID=A0ABN0XRC6_9LACT